MREMTIEQTARHTRGQQQKKNETNIHNSMLHCFVVLLPRPKPKGSVSSRKGTQYISSSRYCFMFYLKQF